MTAPFEWLYDGLPEDGIEQHASLRGDLASDGAAAATKLLELVERDQGKLYPEGGSFATGYLRPLRAEIILWGLDDDGGEISLLCRSAGDTS